MKCSILTLRCKQLLAPQVVVMTLSFMANPGPGPELSLADAFYSVEAREGTISCCPPHIGGKPDVKIFLFFASSLYGSWDLSWEALKLIDNTEGRRFLFGPLHQKFSSCKGMCIPKVVNKLCHIPAV